MPASDIDCGNVECSVRLQLSPVFLTSKPAKYILKERKETDSSIVMLPHFTIPMTQKVSCCQVRSKGLESVSKEDL